MSDQIVSNSNVCNSQSGMGEALCHDLISRGWKVAIVDVQKKPGEALADSLGPNARFFFTNIADYSSQAQMFRQVWNTWGRIDALCQNAGIVDRSSLYILNWRGKELHDIPPAPDTSCTDVDYKSVLYGTQLAIHFMRHNKVPGGKIVCTGSIASIYQHPSYPEYCGAKAGVLNFIRCVAPILKLKENITINAVLPGIVSTKIVPPEMIAAVSPEWYIALYPLYTILLFSQF